MIGQKAAEGWTDQVGDPKDHAKNALPFRAFRRREDVAHNGWHERNAYA